VVNQFFDRLTRQVAKPETAEPAPPSLWRRILAWLGMDK
jgi:hypothetical protein